MNIGIFVGDHAFDIGGNSSFQNSILNELNAAQTDHKLYVFSYTTQVKNRTFPSMERGLVTHVTIEKPSLMQRAVSFWRYGFRYGGTIIRGNLYRLSKEYSIDIFWFLTHQIEVVDTPFIGTVLDVEHRLHPFFPEVSVSGNTWDERDAFFRFMIPRASYVICGTEEGKRQVVHFFQPHPDQVRVVPFFAPSFVNDNQEIADNITAKILIDRPYLLYPAQFWPHKNHVCLLNALKNLIENNGIDLQLVFTGTDKGNAAHVRHMAQELGIMDRVIFTGFVSNAELAGLYRSALALVYPSFFGPDNLPPLEAFALGCPVIAADGAGAREQLGDAALLIDSGCEHEISAAVINLIQNPQLRSRLVESGYKRVFNLTPAHYVSQILSIVDEFKTYRRCWSSIQPYIHP